MRCFSFKLMFFLVFLLCSALPWGSAQEPDQEQEEDEENHDDIIDFGPSDSDSDSFTSATHSPVLELNSYIFGNNVLQGNYVDHWFVFFCPKWFEPCQRLFQVHESESVKWQGRMNTELLHLHTRFARVDCAIDKTLCNDQDVVDYPTLVHYHKGVQVGHWTARGKRDEQRMVHWNRQQLTAMEVGTPVDLISMAMLDPVLARWWDQKGLTREGLMILAVLLLPLWAYSFDSKRPRSERVSQPQRGLGADRPGQSSQTESNEDSRTTDFDHSLSQSSPTFTKHYVPKDWGRESIEL